MIPVPAGAARSRAFHIVVEGPAFAKRYTDHRALCCFSCLTDGFRHFTRLAMTEADAALLVTNHNECCEAETTATLDHFRNAVDVNELVDEFAVSLVAIAIFLSRHIIRLPFLRAPTGAGQNSSPPSRAASASAFTRP